MKELFKNFFTKFMKAEEKKARNITRQKVRTDNESIFLRSFNLQDKMMDEGDKQVFALFGHTPQIFFP